MQAMWVGGLWGSVWVGRLGTIYGRAGWYIYMGGWLGCRDQYGWVVGWWVCMVGVYSLVG